MQDTPRRRLYLSTAVDSESNFLDRRGRRRWWDKEGRHGGGEEIRERGKVCRHTEGLARRPKRITEFVFSWTITGVVPSSPSSSHPPALCLPLFRSPASRPPLRPVSRLFQFLSPERNAMATLRGTKFRRKFLRKSHCHLSRSLIRRTYRSSGEVSPPARDDALLLARETHRASVFITAIVFNAGQYYPANLIYLKHSQSDHRELLVELIDGGLIKRARKGKSE